MPIFVFKEKWGVIQKSGSGEPGLYFTNNVELGTNPCCEISLNANQFCNLTSINVSNLENQGDLNERAKAAGFIGTLQASYTDFHYLRPQWKKITEKEILDDFTSFQSRIAARKAKKKSWECK